MYLKIKRDPSVCWVPSLRRYNAGSVFWAYIELEIQIHLETTILQFMETVNFKKRGWHFTASSIRKEQLREWIVTFWEERWKTGQKEEGEWICKGERWVCPWSSRDQPYSWEPLSLLEVDTIMDLIPNTHNGVGIEHQGSHQLPWNIHAKKAVVIFSTNWGTSCQAPNMPGEWAWISSTDALAIHSKPLFLGDFCDVVVFFFLKGPVTMTHYTIHIRNVHAYLTYPFCSTTTCCFGCI